MGPPATSHFPDAVRFLRDGRPPSGPAALLLISDDLHTCGGAALFQHLLEHTAAAVAARRAQSNRVVIVCVDHTPAQLAAAIPPSCTANFIDCSDPTGWCPTPSSAPPPQPTAPFHLLSDPLERLLSLAAPPASSSAAQPEAFIAIDSLSTMLQYHPAATVAAFLRQLLAAPGVSAAAALLHSDMHPAPDLALIRQPAGCRLEVSPCNDLVSSVVSAREGALPHAQLHYWYRRRTGRVRADTELFRLAPGGGGLRFMPMPVEVSVQAVATSTVEADRARQAAGGDDGGARETDQLAKMVAGGMQLGLTPQEKDAKAQVTLPFEHQGSSKRHQADDFREYLPPAAGGHGAGTGEGRLGHITYVRDSEGEYDSDEDPDDDLDF